MATERAAGDRNREEQRSLDVRKAAAKAAMAASEKTGRPVDPRVEKLARD
jgi:hypothetical protein